MAGQLGHRGMGSDIAGAHHEPSRLGQRANPQRQNRVPTQIEEVVMHRHRADVEYVAPHPDENRLHVCTRRAPLGIDRLPMTRHECGPIRLAAGSERNLVDPMKADRNHEVGQRLRQVLAQIGRCQRR